jgi:hypothetical protein
MWAQFNPWYARFDTGFTPGFPALFEGAAVFMKGGHADGMLAKPANRGEVIIAGAASSPRIPAFAAGRRAHQA